MHARLEAARARLEAAAGGPACLPPYTAYPARLAPLATSNDAPRPLEAAGGRSRMRRRTVSVCRRCTPALLVVLMVG